MTTNTNTINTTDTDTMNYDILTNIEIEPEIISCPICLEALALNSTNFTSTPCGHCFHSTCLLENVVRNGAGCPYCRHQMVEQPEEDIDNTTIYSETSGRNLSDVVLRQMEDDALRGLRFFTNIIEGEPHEDEDLLDEDRTPHDEPAFDAPKPTPAQIVERLTALGVTMEDMVKVLLFQHEHDEYEDDELQFSEKEDEIFGKMRIIISNWEGELRSP